MAGPLRCAREWLSRMIVATGFLDDYPNFGPILAPLEPVDDSSCGMMGVSSHHGRVRLHINTAVFDEDRTGFRGVLQHELHHVLLGHMSVDYRNVESRVIMQVAKEISANECITEPLPGDPHQLAAYAKYGVGPLQSTVARYHLLLQAAKDGRYQPPPEITVHCCGAGDAPGDGEVANLPAELQELLARSGRVNREGRRQAVAAEAGAAVIDWREQLRRFSRARPVRRQSNRRPNRRDPEGHRIGELPGWSHRPGRSKLLVAIDTSGSMPAALFPMIDRELRAVAAGADVTIVECDESIRREYAYTGELTSIEGRGGTDLSPVFEREVLARYRPDGIVYFTDGQGPYPGEMPGVRTLWVLINDREFDCPWGARVRMSTDAGEVSE